MTVNPSDLPVSQAYSRIGAHPIPTKLKLLLASHHWKRHGELAEVLGMSHAMLSRYINGACHISSEHLVRICRYFRVGPEEVVGLADDFIDVAS